MTVYNAFIFFNELTQLKIRLQELNDAVDYFVLSESLFTHSGKSKPLFYDEHKDDDGLKEFKHKIIHQIVTDTPDDYSGLRNDTDNELHNLMVDKLNRADWFPKSRPDYCRITFESECLLRALTMCKSDDMLILDEADEIPKKEAIFWLKNHFDPNEVYNLHGKMFYYYFNLWRKDEPWKGSTVCSFEKFKTLGLCENRMRRRGVILEDAMWHFSYMGGADSVKYKIQSHAEQTLNRPDITDNVKNNIDNALSLGRDIYFRPAQFEIVPLDGTFPKYLVDNQDKFKDYIKYV